MREYSSMTEPFSLEDLHDLRTPTGLAVSPDGDRVAFLVEEADPGEDAYRHSLFVVPTDGRRGPHRLTRVADASAPQWGPDGDRLAFLAARERDVALAVGGDADDRDEDDEDGEDDQDDDSGESEANGEPKTQLWVFDLALGGDARQVTEFEEGVREFDWSPDGDRLVVSARDPTDDQQAYLDGVREEDAPYEVTRLQHKHDGAGFLDDVTSYLFVLDSDAAGATRTDATRLDDAYGRGALEPSAGLHPTWGPSDRIGYVAYYGDDPDATYALDVHTVAPDGSDRRTLTDGDVTATGLQWSPDGERLAYDAAHATNVHHPTEVHVADPERGATWSVSASLDRTCVAEPAWVGDRTLLAAVGDEARTRLVRLDANTDDPERVFGTQGTDRTIGAVDATADTTAVVLSHPGEGEDVFALPTTALDDGTEPTRLTALNDDLLADAALPTCERVQFANDDGESVEGLVYLPAAFDPDDADPPGLVCHIHGGPTVYDAPTFSFEYAYWTQRGYAVLNVNYRGSTSYGKAFSEVIRADWGPREADDILSGVDAVVDRGWADPDRLFVSGFSQGGINTLYVVTRDDRFAAAAPEHGIYDFYGDFGPADTHQWYVNDLGLPWENPEGYRSISSIQNIDQVDTPLLITAGERDWRCPPDQAEQLYVSATRAGVEAKLVVYQDEHHNLSRPERRAHRLETLTEWFETHDPGVEGTNEAP
jgi:dipeptidyl aminopeptidase/acylaminoacyl peptidase